MWHDDLPALRDIEEESSAVRRFFFRDASLTTAPAESVTWWEKRRLPYNLAVGAAGVSTLVTLNVLQLIGPDGQPFVPPLPAIVAYGLLANVMYTGGWIAELLVRPLFGRKTPVVGATLFRYGFAFSVGLTLLPITIGFLDLVVRVLKAVL
jgi:hypothetical protein